MCPMCVCWGDIIRYGLCLASSLPIARDLVVFITKSLANLSTYVCTLVRTWQSVAGMFGEVNFVASDTCRESQLCNPAETLLQWPVAVRTFSLICHACVTCGGGGGQRKGAHLLLFIRNFLCCSFLSSSLPSFLPPSLYPTLSSSFPLFLLSSPPPSLLPSSLPPSLPSHPGRRWWFWVPAFYGPAAAWWSPLGS